VLAPNHVEDALAALWQQAQLPADALAQVTLPGHQQVLPSSFAVTTAVQSSLAAAALAAVQIGAQRGGPQQQVTVDATHAVLDSCGWYRVNGQVLPVWDKLSGLYACGGTHTPGWVRIHANFAHHRDGALALLGLPTGEHTSRDDVAAALVDWQAEDFETAAADAGLVVAAARSFEQWDAHPHAKALAGQPPLHVALIDGSAAAAPRPWRRLGAAQPPLHGVRVLDLTRILAGPVAGRDLAAYGAEVMLVNAPQLPNIDNIADTSRGKLSVHIDLTTTTGRDTLRALVCDADVVLQGYRPGALAAFGFGVDDLSALRPGIVCVSLSAYGDHHGGGPWAARRGFDSLVQTATGFNIAEAQAFGATQPRALPFQVLDYSAGHLLAFGAQVALLRQREQGGSWHAQVSLAAVAQWLRGLGRLPAGAQHALFDLAQAPFEAFAEDEDSGFGRLRALRHSAQLSHTPARWARPSMRPGSHAAIWP
jgi:hypothetical protein